MKRYCICFLNAANKTENNVPRLELISLNSKAVTLFCITKTFDTVFIAVTFSLIISISVYDVGIMKWDVRPGNDRTLETSEIWTRRIKKKILQVEDLRNEKIVKRTNKRRATKVESSFIYLSYIL